MSEPRALISAPTRAMSASVPSVSHEDARHMPEGSREQHAESRMPEGPSVVIAAGIPFARKLSDTPPMAPALPAAPKGLFIV